MRNHKWSVKDFRIRTSFHLSFLNTAEWSLHEYLSNQLKVFFFYIYIYIATFWMPEANNENEIPSNHNDNTKDKVLLCPPSHQQNIYIYKKDGPYFEKNTLWSYGTWLLQDIRKKRKKPSKPLKARGGRPLGPASRSYHSKFLLSSNIIMKVKMLLASTSLWNQITYEDGKPLSGLSLRKFNEGSCLKE